MIYLVYGGMHAYLHASKNSLSLILKQVVRKLSPRWKKEERDKKLGFPSEGWFLLLTVVKIF